MRSFFQEKSRIEAGKVSSRKLCRGRDTQLAAGAVDAEVRKVTLGGTCSMFPPLLRQSLRVVFFHV